MASSTLPPLLDAARAALRISAENKEFDAEIKTLIDAAKRRMALAGVSSDVIDDDTDPLVRLGAIVYVRANFGLDNPEAERLGQSFEDILCQMALSGHYVAGDDL